MDTIKDIFKQYKIILKNDEIYLPKFIFKDSNILKKYFEDFNELDLSEYDEEITNYFIKLIINENISIDIDFKFDSIELLINILLLCDKFEFISIYYQIYEKNTDLIFRNIEFFKFININLIDKKKHKDMLLYANYSDELFINLFQNNIYYLIYYYVYTNDHELRNKLLKNMKKENNFYICLYVGKYTNHFDEEDNDNIIERYINKINIDNLIILFEKIYNYILKGYYINLYYDNTNLYIGKAHDTLFFVDNENIIKDFIKNLKND